MVVQRQMTQTNGEVENDAMAIRMTFGAWWRALLALAAVLGAGMALSGPAHAAFGLVPGSFLADTYTQSGSFETQAGKHPFGATTEVSFNLLPDPDPINQKVDGGAHDLVIDLPPGFSGNPQAAATCKREDYDKIASGLFGEGVCPLASQVGVARVVTRGLIGRVENLHAIYNLEPGRGTLADFGIPVDKVPSHMTIGVEASTNYQLRVDASSITQALPLGEVRATLWGVPAAAEHDDQRACDGGAFVTLGTSCSVPVQKRPFLTNPSNCAAGPLTTHIAVDSWQDPGAWLRDSYTTASGPTGCEQLRFAPSADLTLPSSRPDAPSGLAVDLDFPQNEDPGALDTPPLRDAKVTLPEGLTINPGSADGLEACTDAQLGLKSDSLVACPAGAKVGSATAVSPALKDPLIGGVYLRTQNSMDPASGEMFRLALVLENAERGVLVKLPGQVKVDPGTGRITTEFVENPQLPVSKITLRLKDGSRAPLATPSRCGNPVIDTHLVSWSGQAADLASPLSIDCTPGLGGFGPSMVAGTVNPMAGASSPFALRVSKPDGQSDLTGVSVGLPAGLLARLKGNIGSQVGTVKAFAGPGSNPYMLPGKVFLEGQYGDAPFSLRVVVPAVAGPFDLGEVVVRQKVYVDPNTTQVTVVSDPLPTIVKGVPVRLQNLQVDVDKAGFMINPTSCAAKEVKATLSSVAGQTADLTSRFQAGACASLGYTPELTMTMTGKGQTKDGSHPALKAHLVPPAGDANTKKTTVTLPLALALDPGNANGLCEPVDAARNTCPAKSIVGSAQAESVLPDTLKGPVYFVRGERIENGKVRKTLPKLFIPLSANGVTVYVHASSDVDDDRLVTTFDNLPDAPFSSFDLNINGGEHGILAVSHTNTCAATNIADAEFGGQNGKTYTSKVTMGTPCALGIVKSSHTSAALKVTVGGVGAGKVSAAGNGVTKSSRSLTSATTATLTLKLSKATRRALARGRDVKVKVKVAFTAKGQKKTKTASKTLVIHGAKKR
jgi:hypothetical protein